MRIKSKKPLGLEDEEAAGFLEEPFAALTPPLPYKLVQPMPGLQAQPAVVVAANARVRQKVLVEPTTLDLGAFPWPLHHASNNTSLLPAVAAAALPPARPPARRPVPHAPAPSAASGRPTRKRKQTSMGDDMIPPDAILRPFTKLKRAAATKSKQAAGEQAKPSASEQQQARQQPNAATMQQQPAAIPGPYRQVAPGLPLRPAPVVILAVTADITHLAKQQEEDERKRATTAADATVAVRVVPAAHPPASRSSKVVSSAKNGKQEKGEKDKAATSRQRPPRPSRRPTPEPAAAQQSAAASQGATNVAWHAGMELHGGIMYVDPMQSIAAQPPPVVVVGMPARWQEVPVRQLGSEEFSDDPVLASIEFAKHMARTAGRTPIYSGPLQQAVAAEHRLYKERLQRAVFARDGRRFEAAGQEATRRSTRNRQAPQVFLPTMSQQQTARRLRVVVTAEPEDQTATRMGPEFQAELPMLRTRPPVPTQDEAQWLGELVMEAHGTDLQPVSLTELAEMATASDAERAAWVESSQRQLSAAVGSLAAISLGLETMGASIGASWTDDEEAALTHGMRAYGRDFHAIQQDYVPSRTVHDLIDYYYNVLKLKATQRAVHWHEEKAQAAVERQAELDRLEREREAELQRKAERQELINKRRQLREMLHWMKGAARSQTATNFNKPIVRDRAGRAAKLIGSLNAPAK